MPNPSPDCPDQHYVLGFAFTPDFEKVALIRKNKPDWQAGLLNGIGGKVEVGECPAVAMDREFLEETGVRFMGGPDWRPFLTMSFLDFEQPNAIVHCFAIAGQQTLDVRTTAGEEVGLFYWTPRDLAINRAKNDLPWLTAMAKHAITHGGGWPADVPDLIFQP